MGRPKRQAMLLAAIALLALIAAACNGSGFEGADDADAPDDDGAEDTAADGEGAELTLMGWASGPSEDAALNGIIDDFNAQSSHTARTNFVPEYDTALQASLAGGTPPDVIYVDSNRLPDLVEAGVLDDAEDKLDNPDDFYPSLRDAFTVDGTFWCPPKDFSTLALQYNADMLEEAGVEPPTTWEELAAAAEALTTDDRAGLVMGTEYPRWGVFMFQAGGALTDDDFTQMTADSPENREALEFVEQLYHDGYASTASDLDAGWPGEAFGSERAAMTIEGNWIVGAMRNDFPDVSWATAELPVGPAGPGTFTFTVCYAVPATSQNQEAAWELVNYLVSDEALLAYTEQFPVMPGRESLADEWTAAHPDLEAFLAGVEYARPFQFVPGFQAVLDTFNDGVQGIAAGNRQVDEVLERTDEAGAGILGQ